MKKQIKTTTDNTLKQEISEIPLRPQRLEDYIGQTAIKERVRISVDSAKKRQKPLDHILFFGPPGLGKTTLAYIIATEMEQNIRYVMGPSLEKPGDVVSVLSQLEEKDLLFIDEIHRMNRAAEEVLYSAMEDYFVNITIGREGQNKQIKINLPQFTLIGATTKPGMLSNPLRDRFGMMCRMEYYTNDELKIITERTCKIMNLTMDDASLSIVAKSSRGTPRIANRTIARIRDYAVSRNISAIDEKITKEGLSIYGISENGLNEADFSILKVLDENNRALGLETIAALTGEDSGTIENVNEPYLLMSGYIEKTPRGRMITEKGKSIIFNADFSCKNKDVIVS